MSHPEPIHRAAAGGFGANADGYVRGRPDYPSALAGWLREDIGLAPGKIVADVGAGTGNFLPLLLATGVDVVAVEPVDAMRAQLTAKFADVDARAGTADQLPFGDRSLDAIVCAQAFHWFATDAAMREFARVLKPGGSLALVWNVRDESVPWIRRLTLVMAPYEADTPRHASGAWRRAFPAPGFGALHESVFPHVHAGPPEHVIVDRVLSVSFIAALPSEERERVAAALRALIADEPALTGKETVAFPYRTVAYRADRTIRIADGEAEFTRPDAAAAPPRAP